VGYLLGRAGPVGSLTRAADLPATVTAG